MSKKEDPKLIVLNALKGYKRSYMSFAKLSDSMCSYSPEKIFTKWISAYTYFMDTCHIKGDKLPTYKSNSAIPSEEKFFLSTNPLFQEKTKRWKFRFDSNIVM